MVHSQSWSRGTQLIESKLMRVFCFRYLRSFVCKVFVKSVQPTRKSTWMVISTYSICYCGSNFLSVTLFCESWFLLLYLYLFNIWLLNTLMARYLCAILKVSIENSVCIQEFNFLKCMANLTMCLGTNQWPTFWTFSMNISDSQSPTETAKFFGFKRNKTKDLVMKTFSWFRCINGEIYSTTKVWRIQLE